MSDGDALFQAILRHPDEDTPRLAYADWCDENGQPERAEFIRLQIETALLTAELNHPSEDDNVCTGLTASWCPRCGDCLCVDRERSMSDDHCPLHCATSGHARAEMLPYRMERLRDREGELWARHGWEWSTDIGPFGRSSALWVDGCRTGYVRTRPRQTQEHFETRHVRGFAGVLHCSGILSFRGHAPTVFALQPITRVTVSGIVRGGIVFRTSNGHEGDIPGDLWDELGISRCANPALGCVLRGGHAHMSEDQLSELLVAWARLLAGVDWDGTGKAFPITGEVA
jgi:uncharacterized protein (TIGR02996 family)